MSNPSPDASNNVSPGTDRAHSFNGPGADPEPMSLDGEAAPEFELASTTGRDVRLADEIEDGPAVILLNRGPWCGFCAEQLLTFDALEYDLWRHEAVSVLPVFGAPVPELVEMRDRFDFGMQLLSDPDLEVAADYTGVEDNDDHGRIPIPGTFVVDESGVVRYEHVSERPDDRTYANTVRHLVKNGYRDIYPGTFPDPYTPDE